MMSATLIWPASAQLVEIIGKGMVLQDPPPPYEVGDQVTLMFYPSGGVRTMAKPDVPPVDDPQDAYYGWVFSHWSLSPNDSTSLFNYEGLRNPATITIDDPDMKIYATFIPMGTAAHPTENQEAQLRAITRGEFIGWDGLTQIQANELYRKAELYLDDYRAHHEKWGQASTVWFQDFAREHELVYDILGEGATWTGLQVAALAMKEANHPGDPQTLADLNRALDALDILTEITGTPGRIARFAGPADNGAYHWYYSQYRLGAYEGTGEYEGLIWLGYPSRDTHYGVFTGLSTSLAYLTDKPTRQRVVALTEKIIDRLVLDGWQILDGKPEHVTLNNDSLLHMQMRTALAANPTKYVAFEPIVAAHIMNTSSRDLQNPDYWVSNLSWMNIHGTLAVTPEGLKKDQFRQDVLDTYLQARTHMNLGWTSSALLHLPMLPDMYPEAVATLQGGLLSYPDPPKFARKIDLFQDPETHPPYGDGKHVQYAALPSERLNADYNWQRSAAVAQGGFFDIAYSWTPFDFYFAYWAGRLAGAIPPPLFVDARLDHFEIDNPQPVQGEPATLSAWISNPGLEDLQGLSVRFHATNPSGATTLIDEQTLNLGRYEERIVDASWTPQQPGSHTLIVRLDEFNTIEEADEANNEASMTVDVGQRLFVDDSDPAIEYTRGWHRQFDPTATNGQYHRKVGNYANSNGDNPHARLVFEGDEITILYGRSNLGGVADVYIDGQLAGHLDCYIAAPNPEGRQPTFGYRITFEDLGEGPHEIRILHNDRISYLDGFEIVNHGEDDGGVDNTAATTENQTTAFSEEFGGALDPVWSQSVTLDPDVQHLSVLVEGQSHPVTVQILGSAGTLLAEGGELIDLISGIDLATATEGDYQIVVSDPLGPPTTMTMSVVQTVAKP